MFNVIAKALDDGDLALAQIATLQLGLPELADGAAVSRMAAADRLLKYGFNPDEPRDWHGRWTTEGSDDADPPSATDWSGDSAHWPQEKKLLSLEPNFRGKIRMVLTTLRSQGFRPRIVYGWRSVTEQERLFKEGKTKRRFSFHNAQHPDGTPNAYAVDIIDQRWGWSPDAETNGFWTALGDAAKAQGLVWGGDWKSFRDVDHIQGLPGTELDAVKRESGL